MKTIEVLFIALLVSVAVCRKRDSPFKKSTIKIAADDTIVGFWINDNSFNDFNKQSDWSVIKEVEASLFEGDEIKIKIRDQGGLFGLGVNINFVPQDDKDGVVFKTNLEDWECDGEEPTNQGFALQKWPRWGGQGLESDTIAIWGKPEKRETTCRFRIPKLN